MEVNASRQGGMGLQPGFTVLELMLALSLTAVAILTARGIVEQIAAASLLLVEAAEEADRSSNSNNMIRSLVGQTIADGHGATVQGTASGALFTTWCDVPSGWQERCRVNLAVANRDGGQSIRVGFDDEAEIQMAEEFIHVSMLYLEDAADGGTWIDAWDHPLVTPLALGLVLDRDTVILRIGERR